MQKDVDVIILGTGTAALSAASEVRKVTDKFIIISNGIYGTTCIRAGCMPSKVLIHAAHSFHERGWMGQVGIRNTSALALDSRALLKHVRAMREHFLGYALESTETYRNQLIEGTPRFLSPTQIELNGDSYNARHVIIATGSSPIIPAACQSLSGDIITSDSLFDLETLPSSLAVLGMSVLGTEMAQAFSRFGISVSTYHDGALIGGLTDLEVSEAAVAKLREEMDITLNHTFCDESSKQITHPHVFVAMSRKANLEGMGLEFHDICKPGAPVKCYDPQTMQVGNLPVFVAGDVKLGRSILHEASDEGRIAGYNAVREHPVKFKRRTPIQITYTNPTIAVVGLAWDELKQGKFITGKANYQNQGRARIMGNDSGVIHLYVDKTSGKLLGAELFTPEGEHLAHMIAWLIDRDTTVSQALHLPFYHPTIEEGLRTALQNAADQLELDSLSYHGLAIAQEQ